MQSQNCARADDDFWNMETEPYGFSFFSLVLRFTRDGRQCGYKRDGL
jgi:hypothetical protein